MWCDSYQTEERQIQQNSDKLGKNKVFLNHSEM